MQETLDPSLDDTSPTQDRNPDPDLRRQYYKATLRASSGGQMRKRIVFAMAIATVCAMFFTWFYTVHEDLPRWVRAPTSLLLAPVAIADGLAYALGTSRVYGSLPKVLAANWFAWAGVSLTLLVLRSRSATNKRRTPRYKE